MSAPADTLPPTPLNVACLCAEWCGTCRDYRATFDQALQGQLAARVQGRWIDVEDESDLVGAIDVDNFPTLLIARGGEVLFFGTVTPHPSTLTRLMQAALEGEARLGGEAPDSDVRALAARLHSGTR
ncbi:MAG: thioredoxin family protein [Rhizobacter sp.]